MIALSKVVKLKNDNYLDSTSIVHNKKRLSDILSYTAVEIRAQNTQTVSENSYNLIKPTMNITKSLGRNGLLQFKNNAIAIGKGVNLVKISYKATISTNAPIAFAVTKNGITINELRDYGNEISSQDQRSFAGYTIEEVVENDKIELVCWGVGEDISNGEISSNTFMMVEVVN